MADFSVEVKGIAETQRKIFKFSKKLGDRVTALALRSGANFVLKKTRAAAPKDTGRLRRAIVVKNSRINRRRRNGKVGVFITIKAGKKRNDSRGAYYGRFVESGYQRGRTRVAGKFFVKNTFSRNKVAATKLIIRNIESAGKKLVNQLG